MEILDLILGIVQDGLFAALAAIGFAAISNPPRIALKWCGVIAAAGHITRYCLVNYTPVGIVPASMVGALAVGLLAIIIAKRVKCPPETFSFPALLPMIPGIYAYRTVQAFVLALTAHTEQEFQHFFYLSESNCLTCVFVILCMVIGQMLPIIAFKRVAYTVTRPDEKEG